MFWKESKQSAFPSLPFYGDIHDIPCVREKSLKGSTNWSEQLQRNKTLITTTMTFSPTRRSELTCLQNYFPLDLFFEATGKVIRKAKVRGGGNAEWKDSDTTVSVKLKERAWGSWGTKISKTWTHIYSSDRGSSETLCYQSSLRYPLHNPNIAVKQLLWGGTPRQEAFDVLGLRWQEEGELTLA